jgi:hypothetical protein
LYSTVEISMPASLSDVRVVSPAVHLPGLQFRRPPPSGTRSARPARMLTGLPRELERSPSRYGLQAICGTARAAVIELQ